jgi:4-hydroxybenzoate polyprenyltransferase
MGAMRVQEANERTVSTAGAILRLVRPRQFVKNGFVAAPLFFTPEALKEGTVLAVALGVAAFCLISAGLYAVNDIADRKADVHHPRKRLRPLASGAVSVATAAVVAGFCLTAGLALALALSPEFALVAAAYGVLVLAYSFVLKHVAILDIAAIALGFVMRVEAGAVLIAVEPSPWILVMTGLLALTVAVGKRRDDLVLNQDERHRRVLSGYTTQFLDIMISALMAATLVGYLIFTTDEDAMARLGAERLYVTAPFVAIGLMRYLQIVLVEQRSGDPAELLTSDRFLILTLLAWLGSFAWLIYA